MAQPFSVQDGSGAQVAATLLRLGKLARQSSDIFDIDEGLPDAHTPSFASTASAKPDFKEEVTRGSVIEDDLVVQECEFDGEFPADVLAVPGPMAARRRMQERAQQCCVCMEDKEHTFVPSHISQSGQHIQGHRFCSDCWVDFLDHSLRQQLTKGPAALACPMCRSTITVPDVWTVGVDLPSLWTHGHDERTPKDVESVETVTLSDWVGSVDTLAWVDDESGSVESESAALDDCSPGSRFDDPAQQSVCQWLLQAAIRQGAVCFATVVKAAQTAVSIDRPFIGISVATGN